MAKHRIALAAFALAFVCLSGCRPGITPLVGTCPCPAHGTKFGQQDHREFRIYVYTDPMDSSKCSVDVNVATLLVSDHQTVRWISDDDVDYYVEFLTGPGHHGNPFNNPTAGPGYDFSKNGDGVSGNLKTNAGGQYYDYAIYFGTQQSHPAQCKPADDPGFYVK